tara:strand:+ start:206 stop:403 length:198 start_codon:yes stop_codon:yes gene_type:complete
MKLTDQALGSIMMVLQKCLMEQTDIVPLLKDLEFVTTDEGLSVTNPPTLHIDEDKLDKNVLETNA